MDRIESIQALIVTGRHTLTMSGESSGPGHRWCCFSWYRRSRVPPGHSVNDFEANTTRTFILGLGANVTNPYFNDPSSPQLYMLRLDRTPVYIRFAPVSWNDDWELVSAKVTVNPGPQQILSFVVGKSLSSGLVYVPECIAI